MADQPLDSNLWSQPDPAWKKPDQPKSEDPKPVVVTGFRIGRTKDEQILFFILLAAVIFFSALAAGLAH